MSSFSPRALLSLCCLLLCIAAPVPAATPPRIVTLAPNLAELVYAAGAGEQLVGVVDYSDYPEAVRELPHIGDAFRVDFEALRQLQPDIVMTWESGTPRPVVDRLTALGFRIEAFEPRRLDAIPAELERIGELAGTRSQAAEAAAVMRNGIAGLRSRYAGREPLTVFYQISANPWFTVSGEHVISEVLELCGGDNVFHDVPGIAPSVSFEAIVRSDPQVVIAGAKDSAWIADWQQWRSVSAVRANALYSVDPDLVNRSTPRLLEGAAEVCAVLDRARQ